MKKLIISATLLFASIALQSQNIYIKDQCAVQNGQVSLVFSSNITLDSVSLFTIRTGSRINVESTGLMNGANAIVPASMQGSKVILTGHKSGRIYSTPAFTVRVAPILPKTNNETVLPVEDVTIYPNPASSLLRVDADYTDQIMIFSIATGRKVYEAAGSCSVNLRSMTPGNYMLIRFRPNGVSARKIFTVIR